MFHFPMLKEALLILYEMRSHQSNAGGCVGMKLNQVIGRLEAIRPNDYTEVELSVVIISEFDSLFSEFPEIHKRISELG